MRATEKTKQEQAKSRAVACNQRGEEEKKHPQVFLNYYSSAFIFLRNTLMSFEVLRCRHAGSREQTGEPAGEAQVHHEEPPVGTQHGNPAGK